MNRCGADVVPGVVEAIGTGPNDPVLRAASSYAREEEVCHSEKKTDSVNVKGVGPDDLARRGQEWFREYGWKTRN